MRRLTCALALLTAMLGGADAATAPGTVTQTPASCAGRDLMADLSPQATAQLRAAADSVPHSRGLFWRAEKDGRRITLIGTYHFGDARLDPIVSRFTPEIAAADRLLVEAGPEEERQLEAALRADPTLIADPDGPTLPERLGQDDWDRLADALDVRGIPAVIGSKLRPWYVATMLGLSPCMLAQAKGEGELPGLDHRLITVAKDAGIPVEALEPWDTLFSVFEGMTDAEEEDMIRAALPEAEHADDFATTLMGAYFAEDVWLLWEFGRFDAYARSGLSREAVDQQVRLAQRELMDRRNARWIAPLEAAAEEAASRGKAVVAAFGALHLPGENGVLALLERDGWRVSRIE